MSAPAERTTSEDGTDHIVIPNLRVQDVALLTVASSYWVIDLMARNLVGVNHPERLAALAIGTDVLALGLLRLLTVKGVRRSTAVVTLFLSVLLLSRGAAITGLQYEVVGWLLLVLLVVALALLVARVDDHRVIQAGLVGLCGFLLAGPAISLVQGLTDWGSDSVRVTTGEVQPALVTEPDIFLVVLDGYAGLVTWGEDFGITEPAWSRELTVRDFQVPESAWSAYPTTMVSLASLLDMSYPLESGPGISDASVRRLYSTIGGENALVRMLKSNGYEINMVESGWSGSACGRDVDTCIPAPFFDEGTFLAIERTVLGPLVQQSVGYSFTVGAQRTMQWLLDGAERVSENGTSDFVFAHVMAPHPPFFLDEDCQANYSPKATGVTFEHPGVDIRSRESGYLEQATCVNRFMVALTDSLPPSTVVVFTADHGTDRRGQLTRIPARWDQQSIEERLNIMLAVRFPGCDLGELVVLPNLFRRIISCLTASPIPDLAPRLFIYSGAETAGEPSPILEVDDYSTHALFDR